MATTPMDPPNPDAGNPNLDGNQPAAPAAGDGHDRNMLQDQLSLNTYPLVRHPVFDYFALSPFYDWTCNSEQLRMRSIHLLDISHIENKILDDSMIACEMPKQKIDRDMMEDHKGVGLIQGLSFDPPASTSFVISPKCPTNGRSGPLAGSKRPVSYWRDTRTHPNRSGPDPHDDFLDTPLENIRGNLKKAVKEEAHVLPGPVPKDMNSNSSDDETQDINVDPGPQKQQMPVPRPGTRTFKYVEPVRKKAERESLKGIECKDCKKFYDAVLHNDGGKETDGSKQKLRCEHHDGVSRHRYRYAPPLTPEGFWNIGFESEM